MQHGRQVNYFSVNNFFFSLTTLIMLCSVVLVNLYHSLLLQDRLSMQPPSSSRSVTPSLTTSLTSSVSWNNAFFRQVLKPSLIVSVREMYCHPYNLRQPNLTFVKFTSCFVIFQQDHSNVFMNVTPAMSTASSRAATPFGPSGELYNPHEVHMTSNFFNIFL